MEISREKLCEMVLISLHAGTIVRRSLIYLLGLKAKTRACVCACVNSMDEMRSVSVYAKDMSSHVA